MIAWLAQHLSLGLLTGWVTIARAVQVDVRLRGHVDQPGKVLPLYHDRILWSPMHCYVPLIRITVLTWTLA